MAIRESFYYSGQGEVLLSERNSSGEPTGFRKVGNVSALTIGFETEEFEHKQSQDGTRSIDLTLIQEISATLSMTLESIDKANLALVMYGSTAQQASGAATAQTITSITHDVWYPLDAINITAINSVTDDPGGSATVLTEGDDYEVENAFGMIKFLSTGASTEGNDVEVDYDNDAYEQVEAVESGASPERWMRFNGLNTVDNNNPVVVDVYKGAVQPLSEFALINEEIAQLEVEMDILSDALQTSGSKFFQVRLVQPNS